MTFETLFFIACILLLAVAVVAALGVFFVALRFWIIEVLRDDLHLRRAINLGVTQKEIVYKIDLQNRTFPWPAVPLEWGVVAALSAILIETIALGRDPQLRSFWYIAGVSGAAVALTTPFMIARLWPENVRNLVKRRIFALISPRSNAETSEIQEIAAIGREISEHFTEIGVACEIDAIKNCRDILLHRVADQRRDVLPKLIAVRKTLATYLDELRIFARLHEEARREFEWAKNAIVNNGSTTLLDELDRIKGCMHSESLAGFLNRARWDSAHELMGQIRFDLRMVQNVAEGGSDMPLSLEQAYRLLNVNELATNKMIKTVVDALRRIWHPDLTCDADECERRTKKMQQINAAWEMVLAARAINIDAQSISMEADGVRRSEQRTP